MEHFWNTFTQKTRKWLILNKVSRSVPLLDQKWSTFYCFWVGIFENFCNPKKHDFKKITNWKIYLFIFGKSDLTHILTWRGVWSILRLWIIFLCCFVLVFFLPVVLFLFFHQAICRLKKNDDFFSKKIEAIHLQQVGSMMESPPRMRRIGLNTGILI